MSKLTVNYKPFHHVRSQQPRNFEQFCDMVCADPAYAGKLKGLWEWVQWDAKTGEIKEVIWNMNIVTDNVANQILQRAINNQTTAQALPTFQYVAITNGSAVTTLVGANPVIASGATGVTALPCAALPVAVVAGVNYVLDYGSASPQGGYTNGVLPSSPTIITVATGGAALGATSIPVNSFTNAAVARNAGAALVPLPNYTDNPTTLPGTLVQYSSALANASPPFTYTPTTGLGNRKVVVSTNFATTSGTNTTVVTAGTYTDAWLTNANSATANHTCDHVINMPMRVDSSNSITTTNTVSL